MKAFLVLIEFIPEFVSIVKAVFSLIQTGVTKIQIRAQLKAIEKAVANPDRRQAAKEMDDIFGN